MLLPDEIFRIALLTPLMGFAGMAALTTLEVWRQRTAVVEGRTPRPYATLERLAFLVCAGGVAAMVGSVAFRTALDRQGILVGRDLQTVRVPSGFQVVDVVAEPEVSRDDVLARFRPLGSEDLVEVRSIGAGSVAYRAPSPATTYGPMPLIVVAPPDAVRAQIKVPTREVEDLRAAGVVAVDLLGARFVERRFTGRLVEVDPIEGEPSWSLVEIAGEPHPEAVREVASLGTTPQPVLNEVVRVELAWMPPLLHLPLFRLGAALALIGAVLFPAARTSLALRRVQEGPT